MILRLLTLLSRGEGIATAQDLAKKMGVSDGLVRQMMSQAEALGYLELMQPGCGSKQCRTCRDSATCLMIGSAQIWSLTEKGRRLPEDRTQSPTS